jgi:hypothetical protein
MKLYKKDIINELKLNKIWNQTREVFGFTVAGVMWDNDPWKVVDKGMTFDQVTHSVPERCTMKYFENLTFQKRTYTPIAEFHTQLELADYLYNQLKT